MKKITKKEKLENSMQTLLELRVSPFIPVSKINKNSQIYQQFAENNNVLERKTAWGRIQVRNRLLTQYHLDVFNALMSLEDKEIFMLKNNDIAIFFDLYQLAKKMSIKWGKKTKENLIDTFLEMRDVVIVRWDNDNNLIGTYNLIKDAKYSQKREKFGVIISKEYINFFNTQITVNFANVFNKMRQIKGEGEGLIKAIINFFITQKTKQRITLLKLLETIGYPISTNRQVRYAKQIINAKIELLKQFNINYNKNTQIFEYTQIDTIKFLPPAS